MSTAVMNKVSDISGVNVLERIPLQKNKSRIDSAFNDFLFLVEKHSQSKDSDYDWKEDYSQALEDKYESIR